MITHHSPPPVDDIAKALRPIVTNGLPVQPSFTDEAVLGLRGVVARSIDPSDRLNRVKALDDLLTRLLTQYPDDQLGPAARILFGLAPGTRGENLTNRRIAAATVIDREAEHVRKRIEPEIVSAAAWQLHRDSQNYIPRDRATPPPLEASGDTPIIRVGDISSKETAEHEELLSRLWAHVYALRAETCESVSGTGRGPNRCCAKRAKAGSCDGEMRPGSRDREVARSCLHRPLRAAHRSRGRRVPRGVTPEARGVGDRCMVR